MPLFLYNSLTRKKEEFKPINPPNVGLYTCGPTVYWSTHIGHMSKYVGDDILRRALIYNGCDVTHVMNITDVGHLTSDADEGEDKMEKGAKREGLTVWDIAKKYEKEFFDTMNSVNVFRPDIICRATEHIKEQIELVRRIEKNGYAYETNSAVYFDVSKFPEYGKLSGQKLSEKITGAREDVIVDPKKKNPYDFVLWFKRVGRFANHTMHWDSPWGDGFPGWHIECSAMSMKYLGESFDIHTGGIDHIGVHHPAEIAQSESATGKQFVKYWVHRVFITVDGKKMSKSLGNFYTLKDVVERKINPSAIRYLFLTTHYRTPLNFTWESLKSAETALNKLYDAASQMGAPKSGCPEFERQFLEAINDDLNTPKALAVMWDLIKSDYPPEAKKQSLLKMDKIFGLGLDKIKKKIIIIPQEIKDLAAAREKARLEKNWALADELRKKIEEQNFAVEDTDGKTKIKPR
ncbi:cysteine--tRNA ligase [Patescibacteria group bacterium]|nr:cysteine--tRNA ligase [Patescibacteria group bacterium]